MKLRAYALRRILLGVPVVVGVLTVMFVIFSALPVIDRTAPYAQPQENFPGIPEQPACPAPNGCPTIPNAAAVSFLELNEPVPVQWAAYVYHGLTLQWGYVSPSSTVGDGNAGLPALKGQSVVSVLGAFLPYTLELVLLAMLFTAVFASPLVSRAMVHPSRGTDGIVRVLYLSGTGVALFMVGTLALWGVVALFPGGAAGTGPVCSGGTVFLEIYGSWPVQGCWIWGGSLTAAGYPTWLAYGYQSSPTGFPTVDALFHGNGWLAADTLMRLVLPAVLIAYGSLAVLLRNARRTEFPSRNPDYLRSARARGLGEAEVLRKQARPNARVVTVASLGLAVTFLLGAIPILEVLFGLFGVGRLLVFSGDITGGHYDFGILFGALFVFAMMALAATIGLDILRAYLDPRVRVGAHDRPPA